MPRRIVQCLAAIASVLLLTPGDAHAIPFARRLSLRGEFLVGHVLGEPLIDRYSAGVSFSGRLGLTLFDPLSLQLSVTEAVYPSNVVPNSLNTYYMAGLRIEPRTVGPEGRIFAEANGGLVITGVKQRFAFDVAIGWELQITRGFFIGPMIRYGQIYQPDDIQLEDPHDAHYLLGGVSFLVVPSPPPRLRQGSLLAINPSNLPDRDYDGVPDVDDQCPEVTEDHDGFEDDDGCPDLDDDHDGMRDVDDRCPRAPETVNTFEDDDGCPDTAPASPEHIVFSNNQLRLQQRVYFLVDRVGLPARSVPVLRELATFLEAHPEIRRLRIEGHADDRGTRRHGLELSLRRAQNVRAFLIEQGVDDQRLEAVGYGDLVPLATPHDEVTRAGNRRIEFVIADGPAGTAPPPPEGVTTQLPSAYRDASEDETSSGP